MSLSTSLLKAARLQKKIEGLRKELSALLKQARQEFDSEKTPEIPAAIRHAGRGARGRSSKTAKPVKAAKTPASSAPGKGRGGRPAKQAAAALASDPGKAKGKGRGRSSLAGRKRASSPSGPLAPAVVKVLKANGKPMRVADILDGLLKNGYAFNAAEPKKNLAARIYRLSGVRQVAQGLFGQA